MLIAVSPLAEDEESPPAASFKDAETPLEAAHTTCTASHRLPTVCAPSFYPQIMEVLICII